VETVESTLPALVTVHATAAACRPRNAKFVMKYKYARTATENAQMQNCILSLDDHGYLKINEWTVADVGGQEENYGLSGSPTKVKKVENIVFQAKEAKVLSSSDEDINSLIQELIASHTIG
jgi:electron transfer flavoprotein beta subunit